MKFEPQPAVKANPKRIIECFTYCVLLLFEGWKCKIILFYRVNIHRLHRSDKVDWEIRSKTGEERFLDDIRSQIGVLAGTVISERIDRIRMLPEPPLHRSWYPAPQSLQVNLRLFPRFGSHSIFNVPEKG